MWLVFVCVLSHMITKKLSCHYLLREKNESIECLRELSLCYPLPVAGICLDSNVL